MKKLYKVRALIILCLSIIIGATVFFTNEYKLISYAYTEEEKAAAKAWLSSNGYPPTMAGAEQAYQDYLNGKFGPVGDSDTTPDDNSSQESSEAGSGDTAGSRKDTEDTTGIETDAEDTAGIETRSEDALGIVTDTGDAIGIETGTKGSKGTQADTVDATGIEMGTEDAEGSEGTQVDAVDTADTMEEEKSTDAAAEISTELKAKAEVIAQNVLERIVTELKKGNNIEIKAKAEMTKMTKSKYFIVVLTLVIAIVCVVIYGKQRRRI